MMTFLTVVPRWALALVASVKWPVDSTITSAPTEAQSSLAGVALGENLERFSVDGDGIFAVGDLALEIAEDRIVLEKMGQNGGAGEVIDGYEFDVRVAESCAENVAGQCGRSR